MEQEQLCIKGRLRETTTENKRKQSKKMKKCDACQKSIKSEGYLCSRLGAQQPLCSLKCYKFSESKHAPENCCSICTKSLNGNDSGVLLWEAMEFCGATCLQNYQMQIGSQCAYCKVVVQQISLGKYCVRFGGDIRQFCTGKCLEEFKRRLKVCSYCQKDLPREIFTVMVSEVDNRAVFKDFCSRECVASFEKLTSNRTVDCSENCKLCSNNFSTKQIQFRYGSDDGQWASVCSEECLSRFRYNHRIDGCYCENCQCFRTRTGDSVSLQAGLKGLRKEFCSKTCLNLFVHGNRKIVSCARCGVKKYDFDMIESNDELTVIFHCSVNCLTFNEAKKSRTLQTAQVVPQTSGQQPQQQQNTVYIEIIPNKNVVQAPPDTQQHLQKQLQDTTNISQQGTLNLEKEVLFIQGQYLSHTITPMTGNGSCLFESISYLMFKTQNCAANVRREIVEYVVSNWKRFQALSRDSSGHNYSNSSAYRDETLQCLTFASNCELFAAGELYDFLFEVYYEKVLLASYGKVNNPVRRLRFVGSLKEGHYDAYETPEAIGLSSCRRHPARVTASMRHARDREIKRQQLQQKYSSMHRAQRELEALFKSTSSDVHRAKASNNKEQTPPGGQQSSSGIVDSAASSVRRDQQPAVVHEPVHDASPHSSQQMIPPHTASKTYYVRRISGSQVMNGKQASSFIPVVPHGPSPSITPLPLDNNTPANEPSGNKPRTEYQLRSEEQNFLQQRNQIPSTSQRSAKLNRIRILRKRPFKNQDKKL